MKIYIENYDIAKLTQHINELEKYIINKNNIIHAYSEDGLFEIDKNNIYKIDILKDDTKSLDHEKKWSLLIDESDIKKTCMHWLPLYCHFVKTQINRYHVIKTKDCNMELVIVFDEKGVPIDFYIETPNMKNFFAEHINVFLSMLN
jgi:hypothetical protein